MRRETDFLAAVLDTVGALVVVLDREARVVEFNHACEAATGYRADELRGRAIWDDLILPQEMESVKAVFAELSAGMFPNRFENYWRTKDGRQRRIAWSNTALIGPDGEVDHVIGTGLDVTGEREAQDRARSVESLASLATMAASIVHEIRNPLNAAHLQLTLADRKVSAATPDVAAAQAAIHRVSGELERVTRMLEDFLAFARPRPLDRAPVDLFQVVEDVVDYCAPAASTSSVELALHGARVVADVDRDKVRQVLLNLVLNAIQASPPESTVKIAVQAADARAVLTVEDTGPGLPAPAHAVFEPFFTTKPGGTGLGLSIVRRIVEDHGGHIEVESQPARTVFSVRLPIATIRHDAPA